MPDHPRAITPRDLAERVTPLAEAHGATVTAHRLARWLLHEGLADEHDGRLVATDRGVEVGGGLERMTL